MLDLTKRKKMKTYLFKLSLILCLIWTSCSDNKEYAGPSDSSGEYSSAGPEGSGEGQGSGEQAQPGVITAGEWNDLDNWSFWEELIKNEEYQKMPPYWSVFNNNRISVRVKGTDSAPVIDASVELIRGGVTIFSSKTDNQGRAELWVDLFQKNTSVDFSLLSLSINNGVKRLEDVRPYQEGINEITISPTATLNNMEIAFVVDATGSMSDELEYLKTELVDVIASIKRDNPNLQVSTSSVFYRDEGDEYVTRVSGFTTNTSTTIDFIKKQRADGGGDYPEAVHTAMDKAVNELQWSAAARGRLLFLLLDAPPHYETDVISDIHISLANAAKKGIKIIPIAASGVNKETEFLLRFMSMSTNGTYVFVTDHSGIGNPHLEPSVGEFQVEFLNDLMVRLINKYAK